MSEPQIVSSLYAAAAGRLDWSVPLAQLTESLNLWTVQVLGIDKRNGHLMFSVHGGKATAQTALDYFRTYGAIDPRVAPALATPPGQWYHCHEHLDEAFVAADRFYQEFLLPHGGRYVSATVLADTDDVRYLLAFMRGPEGGPLTVRDLPVLERYRHHFMHALQNLQHVRERFAQLGMARELLNQLGHAALLIDETRGIWHRNDAAARMLTRGHAVVERAGLLSCRDVDGERALTEAVYSLLSGAQPEPASRRRVVALRAPDGGRLLALVSGMKPGQTMGAFGYGPRALVVLHDPASAPSVPDPFLLGEWLDLTPAEARVASQIATGVGAKDIARSNGVTEATVRTQIHRILAKSGARSQADLVRIVLNLPALHQP